MQRNPLQGAETLVAGDVVHRWDREFARGSDKKYPSIELVRLERRYFGGHGGKVLEYGFGSGTNLLYLLERGYTVEGLDASIEAVRLVERKLAQHPELAPRARVAHVPANATRLPFADAAFDFVDCISVLSLLGSRPRVEHLLAEFHRVLKPGGRMIVDINTPDGDFARKARVVGEDLYEYLADAQGDRFVTYCPREETTFRALLKDFIIDDLGFHAHRYLGYEDSEFVACVRRA